MTFPVAGPDRRLGRDFPPRSYEGKGRQQMSILILGLGNELIADDGAGILAVRHLKALLDGQVTVVESDLSGIALIEIFAGYEQAVVVDAIQTGHLAPGTIMEFDSADLGPVLAPSPHYSGLPEIVALARQLDVQFPSEIRIFAVEAVDLTTIGGSLSVAVEKAIPELVDRVALQIREWQRRAAHA